MSDSRPSSPPQLPPAFHVTQARELGLSPDQLRHPRFETPHRGVRRLMPASTAGLQNVEDVALYKALGYAPLLRTGEAFSHTTALLLHGCPLRTSAALHVTVPLTHNRARGANVHGHRSRSAGEVVIGASELPLVPATLALVQSATLLSFRELVVAIDHLILRRSHRGNTRPVVSREELESALAQSTAPGIARLQASLQIARVGAESRMETIQHFELARLGLDSLELQSDVFDSAGVWIGRFDLVDHQIKAIIEFDGEQHRTDRRQYLKDETRLNRARQAGFRILRFHREDFYVDRLKITHQRMCDFLERAPIKLPLRLSRYFAET